MALRILDIFFTLIHLIIIGFNLLGWIWPKTRRAHLIVVAATAFCWVILGIWYGWGFCPVTEWQWQIKTRLGEHHLPDSFIKYYADKISGKDINSSLIDLVTAISFGLAALLSIYFNFFNRQTKSYQNGYIKK